ncbi:unnamed protein product [Colias eurytheme]|nr:unnamed protein product [Colias eurytheme]
MISYKKNFKKAFDSALYERVLDPAECQKQLTTLSNSTWAIPFLDASAKLPSGILTLNLHEYGDYFECLAIDHTIDDVHLQGKYCMVGVPFVQNNLMETMPSKSMITKFPMPGTKMINNLVLQFANMAQDAKVNNTLARYPNARLNLGVCLPRPCTAQDVFNFINTTLPLPDLSFKEGFCRLPNDKPYVTADYVAAGVFGTLFLLTILSTCYDLYQVFVRKRMKTNSLLSSFSIYSNTRSLLNFRSDNTTLHCVDGIRALSMLWVICGHTYIVGFFPTIHNGIDTIRWSTKPISSWIHAAPMMVDTYFLLSGIFCIYGKPVDYTTKKFIRSLPKFYVYRYLRLFPLLATIVLLQASVMNWVADGPNFLGMAHATQQCRENWWATLLHVQNHLTMTRNCLIHSWYVAVDTQLHFLSPFVIVFLFGSGWISWAVMTSALLGSVITSVVYSFTYKFPAAMINVWYSQTHHDYYGKYYAHTPVRAAPFIIGIMIGQILRIYRGRNIRIHKFYVITGWIMSLGSILFCIIAIFKTVKMTYEFNYFDITLNAFMRPLWGLAVAWLVFACVHGYGGPLNWFLSLPMWKFPSRVSYAAYLVHLEVMILKVTSAQKTRYFTDLETMFRCTSDVAISITLAFILCVLVDAPANRLMRIAFADKSSQDSSEDSTIDCNERKTKL